MTTAWIEVLREACREHSQKSVARRIGYSHAVVNQVLSGSYKGDLRRVEAAVEGALLNATVECPVLGIISRAQCIKYQRMPFRPSNPMNVQLFKTCPTCSHNLDHTASQGGAMRGNPRVSSSPPASAHDRADQPAVSHNTGSRGGALSRSHASSRGVTRPTDRRKRSIHADGDVT